MSWQHQSVIFLTKFKISFRHIPIGERVVFFFLRRKRLTLWETDQNTENRYLYFCFILLFFLLPSKRFNSIHNPQILPLLCGSPLRDSTNCFAFGSKVTSKSRVLILVESMFSLSVQTSEYASSLTVGFIMPYHWRTKFISLLWLVSNSNCGEQNLRTALEDTRISSVSPIH